MIIGIDASRAVSGEPTGTENYSRELIRALLRIDTQNSYRLYTRQPIPRDFFSARANHEIRAIPFPRLWTHARLSLELLTRPPELLWVPAHVLPLVHPRRSVVTVHDLGNLYFPQAYPLSQRLYHRWSQRWNAHAANHIFADSRATKEDLTKFFGVPPAKVTVVYPAYDAELYRPIKDTAAIQRVRLNFRIEKDYIITIGTIHPRKNYASLLHAVQRLSGREISLLIVGKRGWLYESIFKQAKTLKQSVSFLDYVPLQDMPALVSGARLFVFPSLHEGFGLPILEAQACGVPVACAKTSSLPEAAGEGAAFFDPHDIDEMANTIERSLSDSTLRERLIERGFENVKRFTWEASARVALDALNSGGRDE